mmetsp:Transcript_9496/g.20378  ORF Transcript_9496/g.20378 Transcript_9496/m.20378 type:complete len:277 (+) Transcript_9496:281-1111(+)
MIPTTSRRAPRGTAPGVAAVLHLAAEAVAVHMEEVVDMEEEVGDTTIVAAEVEDTETGEVDMVTGVEDMVTAAATEIVAGANHTAEAVSTIVVLHPGMTLAEAAAAVVVVVMTEAHLVPLPVVVAVLVSTCPSALLLRPCLLGKNRRKRERRRMRQRLTSGPRRRPNPRLIRLVRRRLLIRPRSLKSLKLRQLRLQRKRKRRKKRLPLPLQLPLRPKVPKRTRRGRRSSLRRRKRRKSQQKKKRSRKNLRLIPRRASKVMEKDANGENGRYVNLRL